MFNEIDFPVLLLIKILQLHELNIIQVFLLLLLQLNFIQLLLLIVSAIIIQTFLIHSTHPIQRRGPMRS